MVWHLASLIVLLAVNAVNALLVQHQVFHQSIQRIRRTRTQINSRLYSDKNNEQNPSLPPIPPVPSIFDLEQPPLLNGVRRKQIENTKNAGKKIKPELAVEEVLLSKPVAIPPKGATKPPTGEVLTFPELGQAGIDEKALRATPLGKILFSVLDSLFPVFKEPNWFDVYDPPLTVEENLEMPYFDGYDFVNSSWTFYVRHRYGWWNWLGRLGFVPPVTYRCFIRGDGVTMWSDGFYGDWYINPAINYVQIEKHYGRGYGYTQYSRGVRIFQVQKWNFENEVGRYWNRGLRSYLRNESNYWALEGRIWGTVVNWRPYPRDEGKFLAIRDGTNLTEVFGSHTNTPWEQRFIHSMTLPFYQAHPDQLERVEDNFDYFYRNLMGPKVK